MVPSPEAEADCVRVLADPSATADERQACRLVIAAAQSRTPAPVASVRVLQGYLLRTQTQNRWGQ